MDVAFWAGVAVSVVTGLLVVGIFSLRMLLLLRRRRHERFLAAWRPPLLASLVGAPSPLPVLRRRDVLEFLILWNHLQESVRGESRQRLNDMARAVAADRYAQVLLARRGVRNRLIAIFTLGQLGSREAWTRLRELADGEHPLLSLTAARALVQIDPTAALPLLVPAFAVRRDWSAARIASILREAGPEAVSVPLVQAARTLASEAAARLVGFFDQAHVEVATPVLRELLEVAQTDDHLLTACLRAARDPQLLALVRAQLSHERWHIRMEAAKVLGRLGTPEDVARLESMLADPQWWVRYRVAQALVRLPFLTRAEALRLRERHPDRFARDILTQVLAEQSLA